jgi:hypothetical protein
VERALHVDPEALVELFLGDLAERSDERDGGVVDEHVPTAETIDCSAHQRFEIRAPTDVPRDDGRLAALA